MHLSVFLFWKMATCLGHILPVTNLCFILTLKVFMITEGKQYMIRILFVFFFYSSFLRYKSPLKSQQSFLLSLWDFITNFVHTWFYIWMDIESFWLLVDTLPCPACYWLIAIQCIAGFYFHLHYCEVSFTLFLWNERVRNNKSYILEWKRRMIGSWHIFPVGLASIL